MKNPDQQDAVSKKIARVNIDQQRWMEANLGVMHGGRGDAEGLDLAGAERKRASKPVQDGLDLAHGEKAQTPSLAEADVKKQAWLAEQATEIMKQLATLKDPADAEKADLVDLNNARKAVGDALTPQTLTNNAIGTATAELDKARKALKIAQDAIAKRLRDAADAILKGLGAKEYEQPEDAEDSEWEGVTKACKAVEDAVPKQGPVTGEQIVKAKELALKIPEAVKEAKLKVQKRLREAVETLLKKLDEDRYLKPADAQGDEWTPVEDAIQEARNAVPAGDLTGADVEAVSDAVNQATKAVQKAKQVIQNRLNAEAEQVRVEVKNLLGTKLNKPLQEESLIIQKCCQQAEQLLPAKSPTSQNIAQAQAQLKLIPTAIENVKELIAARGRIDAVDKKIDQRVRSDVQARVAKDPAKAAYDTIRRTVAGQPTVDHTTTIKSDADALVSCYEPHTYAAFQELLNEEIAQALKTLREKSLEIVKALVTIDKACSTGTKWKDELVNDTGLKAANDALKGGITVTAANTYANGSQKVRDFKEKSLARIKELHAEAQLYSALKEGTGGPDPQKTIDTLRLLKSGLENLRSDVASWQKDISVLEHAGNIRERLEAIDSAILKMQPDSIGNDLSTWRNSLDKGNSTFKEDKDGIVAARATTAQAIVRLKDKWQLYQRSGNIPNQKTVESYIGKETGAGGGLANWGYSWADLHQAMGDSQKDGILELTVLNKNLTGGTASQRYLQDEHNHISVAFKDLKDGLVQVTSVHVSVEDGGAENGKPRYWFDVNRGLLTPQGGNNPNGAAARMPANFADIAKAKAKKYAYKFNCRASW